MSGRKTRYSQVWQSNVDRAGPGWWTADRPRRQPVDSGTRERSHAY
jgi:hypothetical protein